MAALAYSVFALLVRALPLPNIFALLVVGSSPYLPLAALSGVVLSALSRRIVFSAIALLVLVATVTAQLPWHYLGRPADVGHYADIRVLSSNLRKGQADPSEFVRLAKDSADVITVSELTPEEVTRLSHSGVHEAFPYSVLIPAPGAEGIGLWSRYPLVAVSPAKRRNNIVAARLRVPSVRLDPLVASVHMTSPVVLNSNMFDAWRNDMVTIKAGMDDLADIQEPAAVIVAGDFNSTPDMRQFRDLLTNGYRDAVQQTGAGFAPTFPVNRWIPPVITIDHLITRNAAAASIKTVTVPGSDHRALLATIHIPLDPTAS